MNGWVKTKVLSPELIKEGKCVVVDLFGELAMGKIHAILENNCVINITGILHTVPPSGLLEIVIEFFSDKGLEVIPLKISQWEHAVTNKEVNTGKLVAYTTKDIGKTVVGRVIRNKPRMTIDSLNAITYSAYMQGALDERLKQANQDNWRKWSDKQN